MKRGIKSTLSSMALIFFFISMFLGITGINVYAADGKNVYVTVEGLNSIISEGPSKGNNALEALENFLNNKKINYKATNGKWGAYIEEINGLKAGNFGRYDGWGYYIKNNHKFIVPQVSIDNYKLNAGDKITVYYNEYGVTALPNIVSFEPKVVKEDHPFKMQILESSIDYKTNKEIKTPIKNVSVQIDNKNYTTNEEGFIDVDPLKNGEHIYRITGYQKENVPKVSEDNDKFIVDSINAPVISFVKSDDPKVDENNDIKKENKEDKNTKEENNENIKKNSIDKDTIDNQYNETLKYLEEKEASPWAAFSLYKAGVRVKSNFLSELDKSLEETPLENMRPGELETNIIGLASLGFSPYDYKGNNFVKELYSRDINKFLTNELIFGLLTYRAVNIKEEYIITKSDLVNKILDKKLLNDKDGKNLTGWAWAGDKIDPDMTAAAINALAPYYNGKTLANVDNNKIKSVVDNSIDTLSLMQDNNGNIIGNYGPSSETDAFVIMALTSVGLNPQGEKFTKNNNNLVKGFLSYKGENGAFNHNPEVKNNYFATEQSFRALMNLKNYNGENKVDYYTSNIDKNKLKVIKKEVNEQNNNENDKEQNNNIAVENNSSNDEVIVKVQDTSSKENENNKKIPKTGSPMGTTEILFISLLIGSLGVLAIYKGRKEA